MVDKVLTVVALIAASALAACQSTPMAGDETALAAAKYVRRSLTGKPIAADVGGLAFIGAPLPALPADEFWYLAGTPFGRIIYRTVDLKRAKLEKSAGLRILVSDARPPQPPAGLEWTRDDRSFTYQGKETHVGYVLRRSDASGEKRPETTDSR